MIRGQQRQQRTTELDGLATSDVDLDATDLQAEVDAAVAKLPDPLRKVVVHCYLEGKTHREASERLECPAGTLRSRLARARRLLRNRFIRRGLAPASSGALFGVFTSSRPTAALKFRLLKKTVQLGIQLGYVRPQTLEATGTASTKALELAAATMRKSLMTKITLGTVVIAGLTL